MRTRVRLESVLSARILTAIAARLTIAPLDTAGRIAAIFAKVLSVDQGIVGNSMCGTLLTIAFAAGRILAFVASPTIFLT